jgi:two-component system cell cycle response regulator
MAEEPRREARGRVLVVDDSRLVRLVVARHLEAARYAVEQADDGRQALDKIERGSFDVVITDLRMPGLDGFEVLEATKRLAPGVEVIILTGTHTHDMSAAIRALRLGAHDYLTKPPAHADEVVLTVERAMEKRRLRESNESLIRQLEESSLTDSLTGVPNRRAFDRALAQEVARAKRHRHPLSFVMLDIDHFKSVNDTCGHDGGDEVLRSFASTVTLVLREDDSLYRYGGEEFVAILPHTEPAGAMVTAQRIVAAVSGSAVLVGSVTVRITTSAGVSSLAPEDEGRDAISRADAALYAAKKGGRNRACSAG